LLLQGRSGRRVSSSSPSHLTVGTGSSAVVQRVLNDDERQSCMTPGEQLSSVSVSTHRGA
jgi:hypothetical protein